MYEYLAVARIRTGKGLTLKRRNIKCHLLKRNSFYFNKISEFSNKMYSYYVKNGIT